MAGNLEDYLLLVHSGMDENVHPQNTMQLLTALARAGKDAELRFYPPGAHGAAFDFASYVTMTEVYTNLLCEHIAVGCAARQPQPVGRGRSTGTEEILDTKGSKGRRTRRTALEKIKIDPGSFGVRVNRRHRAADGCHFDPVEPSCASWQGF
jgi:hypothetical protein